MIIGNRFVKILFITLGLFVLVVNLIYWANQPLVISPTYYINNNEFIVMFDRHQSFIGFSDFFKFLETFPGLTTTIVTLRTWGDIISNFSITNIGFLDALIGIFRLITTPIALSMTIIVDLFRNIIWFVTLLSGNY